MCPQKTDGVSALWDGDGTSQGLGKDAVTWCKISKKKGGRLKSSSIRHSLVGR